VRQVPGSKYERELRFIDTEVRRLNNQLENMRDFMPQDPQEAQAKAEQIEAAEVRIEELLARKKEIEDSFIAVGLDIPDISRNLNANTCRDNAQYDSTVEPYQMKSQPVQQAPAASLDELSSEVESVTGEIMKLEVQLMQAEIDGGDTDKLKMSINTLRARRDQLIQQIKQLKTSQQPAQAPQIDMSRIEALEADNRALRAQITAVRSDVLDIKDQLSQILDALNRDEY